MLTITIVRALSVVALAAGGMVAAAPASAAPAAVYVDCSASTAGSGSEAAPLDALNSVNALTLTPGTHVLFRRGTTCMGQFAPQGQGIAAAPIVIGDYGDSPARAVIDADGATNAVLLKNNAFLQLTDLELTAPGDNSTPRRGVYVYGENGGTLAGITLEGLYIHDVRGQLPAVTDPTDPSSFSGKGPDSSGGVVVDSEGNTTPTAFSGLQILNNRIDSVDRQGIYFWSNWCQRPELNRWANLCTAKWFPNTDVLVAGNSLSSVGGDGIVITGTVGATVEHNSLDGFNRRAKSYNAGMWTANSQNVTFQYNTVTGGLGTLDSQAFDVDHATADVTVRYNYSHDNQGGFLLTCPDVPGTHDFQVYGNISVNDAARTIQHGCGSNLIDGSAFYDNTVYVDSVSANVWDGSTANSHLAMFDNVFVAAGNGKLSFPASSGPLDIHNNLLNGVAAPAGATATVTGPAELFAPGGDDPADYRLASNSTALGAGTPGGSAATDYFGTAIPGTGMNLGAYQGPGLQRTFANGCALSLSAGPATTANGIASISLDAANPCTDNYAGGAVSADMSSDFALSGAPTAAAIKTGASVVVRVAVSIPAEIASGTYPVTLSLGGGSVTVPVTVAAGWNVDASQNFDATVLGAVPTGWVQSNPASSGVVAVDGNKALQLTRVSGTTNLVRWPFGQVSNPTKVTLRIRAGQADSALGIHLLDSNGNPVARLSLADTGVWAYTDGNTFVNTTKAYAADTWYTLQITVDGDSYSASVDGAPLGSGTTTGVGGPTQLRLQIPSSAQKAGTFLADDIAVASEVAPANTRTPAPAPVVSNPQLVQQRPAKQDAVTAGDSVGLLMSGFRPDTLVTATADDTSAFAVAAVDGTVRMALPIPPTQPSGTLSIVVSQGAPGAAVTVTTSAIVDGTAVPAEPGTGENDGNGGSTAGNGSGGATGTIGGSTGAATGPAAGADGSAAWSPRANAASHDADLASTGSDVAGALLIGLLIVVSGGLLVIRRRRKTIHTTPEDQS